MVLAALHNISWCSMSLQSSCWLLNGQSSTVLFATTLQSWLGAAILQYVRMYIVLKCKWQNKQATVTQVWQYSGGWSLCACHSLLNEQTCSYAAYLALCGLWNQSGNQCTDQHQHDSGKGRCTHGLRWIAQCSCTQQWKDQRSIVDKLTTNVNGTMLLYTEAKLKGFSCWH